MPDIARINEYIQEKLRREKLYEVAAVDAARWLNLAGILRDSPSRPGKPLRNLLREGLIVGQIQQANGRWFIRRVGSGAVEEAEVGKRRDPERPVSTKSGLPPISDESSRILILGTLPGDESIRCQQYYANPRNQFWRILGEVLGEAVPSNYQARVRFLLSHHIALWDVLSSAFRPGSLDSNINTEVPNKIEAFLDAHSEIAIIAFNGAKAEKMFHKHVPHTVQHRKLRRLPSSSGALATPFGEKVGRWRDALIRG